MGDVEMTFEVDDDASGLILVNEIRSDTKKRKPATAPPVDIRKLKEGAILRFEGKKGDEGLMLGC